MARDDIISHTKIITRHGMIQRGINYGKGRKQTVILMSGRKNAPYVDKEIDGQIIYEGEDVFGEDNKKDTPSRHIPSDVQIEVWKRDKRHCVSCGSIKKLHFDHIIPLSKGGANSVENIQILCASCNLKKHDKVGGEE